MQHDAIVEKNGGTISFKSMLKANGSKDQQMFTYRLFTIMYKEKRKISTFGH